MRLPHRYTVRFVLADGTPRTVTAYAFTELDAETDALRQLRATTSDDQRRGMTCYGAERTV